MVEEILKFVLKALKNISKSFDYSNAPNSELWQVFCYTHINMHRAKGKVSVFAESTT